MKNGFRAICACVLVCLAAFAVHAQTPVSLAPVAKMQFFDDSGAPLAGGFVFTYACGTTSQIPSYQDSSGVFSNTNPIVLDSAGRANFWMSENCYKVVVQNSLGVQLYSVDGVQPFPSSFPSLTAGSLVSATNSPALSGFIRMATTDQICWRNFANSADVCLSKNSSDQLFFGGIQIPTASQGIFNTLAFTLGSGFTTTFSNVNTATRLVTFPDASGTVCLLTDCPISSAVFSGVTMTNSTLAGTTTIGNGPTSVYNSSGTPGQWGGLPIIAQAGMGGVPIENGSIVVPLACATSGPNTIVTAPGGGLTSLYNFVYYIFTQTAGSGGTLTVGVTWTDPAGMAHTTTSSTIDLTSAGSFQRAVLPVVLGSSQAMTYTFTANSVTGSPVCGGYLVAEKF